MVSGGEHLPSFEEPPVVETILGVQFLPMVRFKGFHAGVFSSQLGPEWTEVEEQPLIAGQFERFESSPPWDLALAFDVGIGAPPVRLCIRNADRNGMIQVQRDRIHYNWLGRLGAKYPRYQQVRKRFDELFTNFRTFLKEHQLGDVAPNQWEVTYVNQLSKGSVWATAADHLSVLKLKGSPIVQELETEAADVTLRFLIPPNRGRLHVESRQQRDAVRLTLTARGPAKSLDEVSEGLDIGRRTIVTAFAELTSVEAQKKWRPTS